MADPRSEQPNITPHDGPSGARGRLLLGLLFASGAAGLIYQVLWMRQLGLLFGNTAQATSTTLAAFFAGLAAGGWFWGRRAGRSRSALRLYARLEFGIVITALVYYGILELFYAVYPTVCQSLGDGAALTAVKLALALLLIFPPAFCMGGTLPAIGQHLIRRPPGFGRTSALLYGVNTFGAAVGVVATVFLLIPTFGFAISYALAIALSAAVGTIAFAIPANEAHGSEQPAVQSAPGATPTTLPPIPGSFGPWSIAALCFVSGSSVLALEVIWTRMLAQVHSNSVYAFAVMLTVVLTGLAVGAWISSRLARLSVSPAQTLAVLIAVGGAALALGPSLFMAVTNDMAPQSSLESWGRYMLRLFAMAFGGIGIVVVALGTVFPFIMKAAERLAAQPGQTLGRLLAANTLGAILGALMCGFVLLPWLGMWRTMQWVAALYLVVALLVPRGWRPGATLPRAIAIVFLAFLFTGLDPTALPTTGPPPGLAVRKTLETWEGPDCTVSVTEVESGHRVITLNSGYKLGSTAAYRDQVNQSRVPLDIFPHTRSLFFLGMGTGISAGAALEPTFEHVEQVVACELVRQVVDAAKKYIPPQMLGGLFTDPRATILIEDGRHHLRVTDQKFDMINADLFLPYRRGAGSLYSLDHYQAARQKLQPGGVYVQWLPLYQITESEFGIIARTMIEAFGQVTMWRNNFTPGHDIVALIGQVEPAPIPASPGSARQAMFDVADPRDWAAAEPNMAVPDPATITFFYAGNLTRSRALFAEYPINTDDRPLIEYQTPRTFRRIAGEAGQRSERVAATFTDEQVIWFVGPKFAQLVEAIFEACPLDTDPALADRTPANRRLALAGEAFHRSMYLKVMGDYEQSLAQWQRFITEWRASAD